MKKRIITLILIFAMMLTMAACGKEKEEEVNTAYIDKKVGICIYKGTDDFMKLYEAELRKYLISQGFADENIETVDANNDQKTQDDQVKKFIENKVDVLIVNPVNPSNAKTITDMAVDADIPLIYINREPDKEEQDRWSDNGWKVAYVGCDARQSGKMQGEIVMDLGLDVIDLNKDGKVQYIMVEGDPENIDAQYRTQFSIKAINAQGIFVDCIDDQVGNWEMVQAQTIVADDLMAYGNKIEVIFCNNDAMALGAIRAIKAAGRTVGKDVFLVGVDALKEACQAILDGDMTGTVFNDHITQAHSVADCAIKFIEGKRVDNYIGCDYVKVTKDNAQEILDLLK